VDRAITQVIHPPPRSITWLVTVVYQAGSFGVAVTLAGLALLARRWEIARDIGLSAAGTAAAWGILIAVLGGHGGRPGGTAAVFATRVRFFQKQGYDATVALSSGAIMTTSSWIATAVLFGVSLPLARGSLDLEATPQGWREFETSACSPPTCRPSGAGSPSSGRGRGTTYEHEETSWRNIRVTTRARRPTRWDRSRRRGGAGT
jgi:hypothetical protein